MLLRYTPGFQGAPVTKILLFVIVCTTLLAFPFNMRDGLALEDVTTSIVNRLELWRLFSNQLFFSSPSETLFGLALLYFFRVFERLMGPAKFGTLVLLCLGLGALFEFSVLAADHRMACASGPYPLLFALFVLYFWHIPVTSHFTVVNVSMTDKTFVYCIGLQLLLSDLWGSIVSALCGILIGMLYSSPVVGLNKLLVPQALCKACRVCFLPFLSSAAPTAMPTSAIQHSLLASEVQPTAARLPTALRNRFSGSPAAAAPGTPLPPQAPYEPSEAQIERIVELGFSRASAINALRQSGGNLEYATNILLEHSGG